MEETKNKASMEVAQDNDKGTEGFKISGDWNAQSKKLKEEFPQLTDADLKFEIGKEEDLLKRVSTRLNKKNEEVVNILQKGQAETV